MPVSDISNVVLVGFPSIHQKLLGIQLASRFNVHIHESIADILNPDYENSVIFIFQPGSGNDIRDEIISLRTQRFVWWPAIILKSNLSVTNDSTEWSISHLDFPPDIAELTATIDSISDLPGDRRIEIVRSSILHLHSDLSYIIAGNYQTSDGDFLLRREIREIDLLIRKENKLQDVPDFDNLIVSLRNAAELPNLIPGMIADLRTSVIKAESAARESKSSAILRSRLHQFSNSLRYSEWASASSSERTKRIITAVSHMPRELAEIVMPGAAVILKQIEHWLELLKSNSCTPFLQVPTSLTPEFLKTFDRAIVALRVKYSDIDDHEIKRIVLIEDDIRWHAQIRSVMQEIAVEIEIYDAYDYVTAKQFLDIENDGTLAVIDLGLPKNKVENEESVVDLDAGLKLMRECMKSGCKTKFLILTAAQNYADAVRESLSMGVQPSDYIQKDPTTWEQQLRSRLIFALSRRKQNLPVVEVFRSTARLIRVMGIEVLLERKPYVVFEYLAKHARTWSCVDGIRSDLTQPGDRDITPSMSKVQLSQLNAGFEITPFDILTPKHIQDYVYDIRQRIIQAFVNSGMGSEVPELISYNSDLNSYRLIANVRIYDKLTDLVITEMPKRILVVEDHPEWSRNISLQLSSLSFEVKTAHTLFEFEETIKDWIPDIVTLDLQIPRDDVGLVNHEAHEQNGVSVIKILKERYPEIRVIVLTSIAWDDSIMLGILKNGVSVDDYLDKRWDNAIERLVQSVWRLSIEIQHGSRIPTSHETVIVTPVAFQSDKRNAISLGGLDVTLSDAPFRVFKMLAASPNAPVDRDAIVDELWSTDELSETYEDNLNTIIRRLRKEITDQTNNLIDSKKLVRSTDGVYWLQGVITA